MSPISLPRRQDSSEILIYTPTGRTQQGWRFFIRHNMTIVLAFLAGLSCTVAVIVFTFWLSQQILECPTWSINCTISKNIGTIQGIITAVYAIGLATLAYATHSLSEAALWPLINQRPFTIKEVETYLQASRGSIASSPFVLKNARSVNSAIVILCIVTVTFLPLAGAPLTGYVYNLRNSSAPFESYYQPGGGIGPPFIQRSPLESYRDAHSTLYNSWALGISREPMPEYRGWFIDRINLTRRGDMTVGAVRVDQNISCRSWELDPPQKNGSSFVFPTSMAEHRRPDNRTNDPHVLVRAMPQLAVWAHDFRFLAPTRTLTTLVFAALNGSIGGGSTISLDHDKIKNISSMACDVDVALVDDTLKIGEGQVGRPTQINSITHLLVGRPNKTTHEGLHTYNPSDGNTLNELALWFTVAPITAGVSLFGAQPMWMYSDNGLPRRYTSANGGFNSGWNTEYIKNFIRICIGSAAQAESRIWPDGPQVTMSSAAYTSKLDPHRVPLLLTLPLIIISSAVLLSFWNSRLHRNLEIPIMRKANLSEILKSSQTEDIITEAGEEMLDPGQLSKLKHLKVRYQEAEDGLWGLQSDQKGPCKSGWDRLPRVETLSHYPSATSLDRQC
ncbi:hypothetical protein BU26DRAFT_424249 [Trematosphaeria pertusa]|uniref:Uncharacterized protein n=1 Tax=Trematosphaeria pertusa TaxID=390896 RepID=A0A6A6IM23_9PLEO|nr:uncharacterized protein BU26DRAFT_424249 [Trematosphaeria pertusa]KAF2251456.1 hypothetical protein BU26DRAFT_424249 [Trematosphaeria pertusa]